MRAGRPSRRCPPASFPRPRPRPCATTSPSSAASPGCAGGRPGRGEVTSVLGIALNYRFAYRLGFHPWEDLAEHPPYADKRIELVARDEDGRNPPYGPALDIGTGSAVWGIRLAERGWQGTGGEIGGRALERARARAREAGVDIRLVRGDVTALREAGVGSGFRLLVDTGTFHGLTETQRAAMGREGSGVAAPDTIARLFRFDELFYRLRRREPA